MMITKNRIAGIAAGGALLLFVGGALAQQPQAPAGKGTTVSDDDLRAFVRAYVENQKIRDFYEPELAGAGDAAEREGIQNEASDELQESLDRENMSLDNYNRIYIIINNADDRLREKVLKMVEEERAKTR
ncbi:MAG TPA: DUF4168 domain-containing protein [Candidatus Binatia bacterium]